MAIMIDLYNCDTYRSLVKSIVAHPEDTNIRLIFADYLEEQGDQDWADFIRISISHALSPREENCREMLKLLFKEWELCGHDDPPYNWERWMWRDNAERGGNFKVAPSLLARDIHRQHCVSISTSLNDGLVKQFFSNGFIEYVIATRNTLNVYGEDIRSRFPIRELIISPSKYESWNWSLKS
jgi:uncharacterized protein (TIGR02996 family)